ncbi:PAC2 family-domain-containing protein [Lyophyllum atratum]|nr:PAC2 family-domain-containing protein [Lyophyllum atratum]
MSPFIYPVTNQVKLAGKTLIVPIVSTANVSQLAADLLIASFSLHCLAIFNPEFLVPMIGAKEDGEEGITTPLELYGASESDLLVIQQRSPVLKSRKQVFVTSLIDFIRTSGVGSVLFLSGVDLSNRMDSQMFTPTYQLQPRNSPSLAATSLDALTSLPIPTYTSPVLQSRILGSLPQDWPIPTASLLQFVLEGDNRADARLFAAVVAKVVGHNLTEWRQPSSWKTGLFGAPHDQTLYG